MEEFQLGDECYHKATGKKCVIIAITPNKLLKVRTESDEEKEYYPTELRKATEDSGINGSDNGKPMFTKDMKF